MELSYLCSESNVFIFRWPSLFLWMVCFILETTLPAPDFILYNSFYLFKIAFLYSLYDSLQKLYVSGFYDCINLCAPRLLMETLFSSSVLIFWVCFYLI